MKGGNENIDPARLIWTLNPRISYFNTPTIYLQQLTSWR